MGPLRCGAVGDRRGAGVAWPLWGRGIPQKEKPARGGLFRACALVLRFGFDCALCKERNAYRPDEVLPVGMPARVGSKPGIDNARKLGVIELIRRHRLSRIGFGIGMVERLCPGR